VHIDMLNLLVAAAALQPGSRRSSSKSSCPARPDPRSLRSPPLRQRDGGLHLSQTLPYQTSVLASAGSVVEGGAAGASKARSKWLVAAVGSIMTLGSLAIFAPIIMRLLMTGDASGMSLATWGMNLLGYSAILLYNIRRGIPLDNFIEYVFLAAQSLMINCLIRGYQGTHSILRVAVGALGSLAAFGAAIRFVPERVLAPIQAVAAGTLTLALLPQLWSNLVGRTAGGWSPISATLATGGNAIRVVTTATMAGGDTMLLMQFILGVVVNACMLLTTLIWR